MVGRSAGQVKQNLSFIIEIDLLLGYTHSCLVVLGGELAVSCNPKSAYAGLKSLLRVHGLMFQGASPVGRHATGGYESRQVREEAAVSRLSCVVVCFDHLKTTRGAADRAR